MERTGNRHPADRRIDGRVVVDGIVATWGLDTSRFRRRPAVAHVINVSRGGLLALVPYDRALATGVRVPIEMCGGTGTVEVSHIRASARRRWRMCGLHLVDGDAVILDAIERILSDHTGEFARVWSAVG